MENEALRKIGLTEGEVKVYTALLELGPSASGPIIKDSGVSSSKVYPILNRLISMGLVSYITRGSRRVFQTTSPTKIFELLEKRKAEIEEQKRGIEKILPALLKRHKSRAQKHEATIYEGYRGVRTFYNSLLNSLKKPSCRTQWNSTVARRKPDAFQLPTVNPTPNAVRVTAIRLADFTDGQQLGTSIVQR